MGDYTLRTVDSAFAGINRNHYRRYHMTVPMRIPFGDGKSNVIKP